MTTAATNTTAIGTPAGAEQDVETRALWNNAAFRATLQRSRHSAAGQGTLPLDKLDRRRPLSDVAKAHAAAYLAALDQLEDEQDAEVTDDQGRLLHLVLTAAAYARGQGNLAELVEESGCPESEIRAVAAALRGARLLDVPDADRVSSTATGRASPHDSTPAATR